MSAHALDCWKCGAPLVDLPLPVGRSEYCRACRAEVHVCRMCRFYDLSKARQCAEPVAEPVQDKERANFCGYFEPVAGRFRPRDPASDAAHTALEALFGPKK
jgi:hypothetical protein